MLIKYKQLPLHDANLRKKDYGIIEEDGSELLSNLHVFNDITDEEIKHWMEYNYVHDVSLFDDSLYIHFSNCTLIISIPEDALITQHPLIIKDQRVEYIGIKQNDNYYGTQEYFSLDTSNVNINLFSPTSKLKYCVLINNNKFYNNKNTLHKHQYCYHDWNKGDCCQPQEVSILKIEEVVKKYEPEHPSSYDYCYLDCAIRPRQFVISFRISDEYLNELTPEEEEHKLLIFENAWTYESGHIFDINKTHLNVGVKLARNGISKQFRYELFEDNIIIKTTYFDFLIGNYTNIFYSSTK